MVECVPVYMNFVKNCKRYFSWGTGLWDRKSLNQKEVNRLQRSEKEFLLWWVVGTQKSYILKNLI